ncbi:Lactate utilization protein B [compost metagenome]
MERGLRPWQERFALQAWGYVAKRPELYAFATRIGAWLLGRMGGSNKLIASLPMAGKGWTETRDMPAPSGRTFRELYKERRARS